MGREKCSCWLGRDFFFLGSEGVLAYLGIRSMLFLRASGSRASQEAVDKHPRA